MQHFLWWVTKIRIRDRKYTFGMMSLIKVRINEHKQVEAKKEEAQRARIRQEETERLQEAAEEKRKEAETNVKAEVPAPVAAAERLQHINDRNEAHQQQSAAAPKAVAYQIPPSAPNMQRRSCGTGFDHNPGDVEG
ncbi:hypothetical protein K5D32_02890 [Pseudomonas cichorii]|uniref:hypothetical protein n=1 Tax=Pseudomonas cichorii TaxID=36746 RepID=UPI001C89DC1F|nr:hypothetical protein [Pseudomonas cichorii]MBX8528588.1 hypothetical protein [Pseudomonas cichorii]